jgi:D-erythronate 2-dehydrogenase
MKVFITGGGGFLGYRLALQLLERKTLAEPDGRPAVISQIKLRPYHAGKTR